MRICVRIGMCAACYRYSLRAWTLRDQVLFKVGDQERWRCERHYRKETGKNPC